MRPNQGVWLAACIAALCGCGSATPVASRQVSQTPAATSLTTASATNAPNYAPPRGPERAFVQRYLDAVIAGHCAVARSMMLTPEAMLAAGYPSPDARGEHDLCGRGTAGQITIDAWRWGDQQFDGSGTEHFSIALIFRVRSGHVGAATSWTGYRVPKGWVAYQLPMYSSDHGLYVAGAPFR